MVMPPRTSESYFRTLFQACGEAFFVTNDQGQAFDCNDAATSLFGCQRGDILETTPLDWSPTWQPNGRRSDEWAAEIFARAAAGETVRFEWENVRLDHSPVFVSVTVRRTALDGQSYYLVISRDISDRKRVEDALRVSELRLRNIIQALPIPLALNNEAGYITFLNSAFTDTFGYAKEDISRLDDWWPRAYPDTNYRQWVADTWQKHLDDAARNKSTFEPLEVTIHAKDGSAHSVIAAAASLDSDFKGEHLVMLTDISERKQNEQILLQSVKEKQALLHEVHHRVKNNLQVIVSLLRLEAGRSTEAGTKAVLTDMQDRIRSMALLHESLYRTGIFASVDLGSYLQALANQALRGQGNSGGTVRLVVDCATLPVSMDLATPCGLLVNELISNCLKHGFPQERSGEVRIELHALNPGVAPSDGLWRLRVSDNGVGLPADFDAKRTTSLGLQLVGDLSRQMGGTLEIDSQPDAGTAMSVRFKVPEVATQQ